MNQMNQKSTIFTTEARDEGDGGSKSSVPSDDELEEVRLAGRNCMNQGFAAPIRVLSPSEAQHCLLSLQEYEEQCGGSLRGDNRFKIHVLLPWAWDLVHHPVIVELACACLRTRDVWCWSTDLNMKEPASSTHYTWHQDSTYAGLSPPGQAVTIWLALTPSRRESGCLRCIPRSHQRGQLPHVEGQGDTDNALSLQQEITNLEQTHDLDPDTAQEMVLEPGQASVHSFLTVHSSSGNTTNCRRIGLAMRFVSANATKAGKVQESATLVSGEGHNLFQPEMRPMRAMGSAEQAKHAAAMSLERTNYMPDGRMYS
jgi:non-heme Fe2+,alpha-ketoglutarate-dependent halogenase